MEPPSKKTKGSEVTPLLEGRDSELSTAPPVPEHHTRCNFFMVKKHRFCKMQRMRQQLFCSDHIQQAGIKIPEKRRIICPLDATHTCFEHLLDKHLKKCNSRPELRPSCFSSDINAGDWEGADPDEAKISLKSIPVQELKELIKRVEAVHKDQVGELRKEILFHPVMKEESEKPSNGLSAQKHIQQQASLIGHMDRLGLLTSNSAYVEFGAGKGGLSHWVQLALNSSSNTHFYLVEKSGVRYAMDSYHRGSDQGPSFDRLRLNIVDLNLAKVEKLNSDEELGIVGMGKHLCGGATDLMLRCLIETYMKSGDEKKSHLEGVVLAYCCHHRCDWKSYTGKLFMRQNGFTPKDFHLITRMASWAVSQNTYDSRKDKARKPKEDCTDCNDKESVQQSRYNDLSLADREKIGYKCKQLIDEGRKRYLMQECFDAEVLYYVEKERTLENMALVAKCSRSK